MAQTGQSLLELSIAVVLFFVLVFGVVDAGRLIYAYNVVSASAREGVRYAAVRGGMSVSIVERGSSGTSGTASPARSS